MAPWRNLTRVLDDIVDTQWSERIVLRPQASEDEYSKPTDDPTRPVWEMTGTFMRVPAEERNTPGGQRAQGDYKVSIQDRYLPPYDPLDGDLVELPESNRVLQFAWADPLATGRTYYHLLQVNR